MSVNFSTTNAPVGAQRTSKWREEPTLRELLLLVALGGVLFYVTTSVLGGWHKVVLEYGDNLAYLQSATAIRNWDFHGIDIHHFLGYPYAIAAVSRAFHLPTDLALTLVAGVACLASTFLVARLFGPWVAGYFAFTNLAWLQASFAGGSEPLAVALGLGAFASFRRGRTLWATLLAALATTVRPLTFFALIGIGIALLYRKHYAKFLSSLSLGIVIGLLYVWPLTHYFADPWLTVRSYVYSDYGAGAMSGPHGHLFGWPFHAIVVGTMVYPAPWTNLVLSCSWIALVVAGVAAMFFRDYRQYARANPAEAHIRRVIPAGDLLLRLSGMGAWQLHALFDSCDAFCFLRAAALAAQGSANLLGSRGTGPSSGRLFRGRDQKRFPLPSLAAVRAAQAEPDPGRGLQCFRSR